MFPNAVILCSQQIFVAEAIGDLILVLELALAVLVKRNI